MIGENFSELGGNFCPIWRKIMFAKLFISQGWPTAKMRFDVLFFLFSPKVTEASKSKNENSDSPIPSQT